MYALGEWTGESIEIEGNVFEKYLETVKELRTKESLLKLKAYEFIYIRKLL